ncbi:hypothetical protein P4T70_24645 [Bacillus mobilis]|uniref:hypothetical protein n=1 Tax=Bacillus mobilis TaxID=2026190 RepID=UPI002E1BEC32|nr:hypothetical protein [Bacillus mobilis]
MFETDILIKKVIDKISKTTLLEKMEDKNLGDIEDIISYIYKEHFENKDAKETLIKVKKDSVNRTKRRWTQNAIKDYDKKVNRKNKKELLGEFELLNDYYEKNGKELFLKQFNSHPNPESVIEERKQLLLVWSESDEKSLSSYPYLHQKTKKQVETAIFTDITMIVGMTLLEEERNSYSTNIVVESPFSAIEYPIFGNVRGKVKVNDNKEKNTNESDFYADEYSLSDGNKFDILISKDYVDELNHNVKDLDPFDYKLFLEVMSHRDETFTTQRTIIVTIGDLVKKLYTSDGKKNYTAVSERLLKMGNFRFTNMKDDGEVNLVGVFSDVKLTPISNGNVVARIVVADSMYQNYIQRQTVLVYKQKVDELKVDLAHHLVFVLQKERMICYQTSGSYKISRDLIYFAGSIRFKKRSKPENIKEIEKAFDEIIEKQIIVKAYRRIRDTFHIEFYPVEEQEAKDLLETNYKDIPMGLNTPL